ncbi:MAG TPA: MaoC/PaaZ C-terminal domain-containing protein [Amycolatopsis sp.]|nr:MaoC/PaaZ C-terminal domain-containing protein [Amycolatopsis sp.]
MILGTRLDDYVGRCFATITGADEVNEPAVRHLLEAMEWDWPDAPVPLSTYLTFALPSYRNGDGTIPDRTLPPLPFHEVPAPGSRAIGTRIEVAAGDRPMRYGDRLRSEWFLQAVTPCRTRVGDGLYLDYETRFRNQCAELVAVERTRVLRFDPRELGEDASGGALPIRGDDSEREPFTVDRPRAGTRLAEVTLPMSLQRLVMLASANRDFAPIHHDPAAAAEIGASAPVVNTMFLLSFAERLLVENGGPAARAVRLGPLRLLRPTPSGGTVTARGTVREVVPVPGGFEVEADVEILTGTAGVTVAGPGRMTVPR